MNEDYDSYEDLFDYNPDEGSDLDNYEDEQVFQDQEEDDDDEWETFYPDPHEDSSFLDISR
jgi:hypothetical protein